MVEPKKVIKDIGPGVLLVIKETDDRQGFRIKLEGSFRSGNDIDTTVKDIEKFWESLDIDC